MARLEKIEAEDAISEWACGLVNTDEGICSLISEAKATGVGPDTVEVRSVWRGERGKPHFSATITFRGESYWPSVISDAIIAKIKGTFSETRARLAVDSYVVDECDFDQTNALAADAYWASK